MAFGSYLVQFDYENLKIKNTIKTRGFSLSIERVNEDTFLTGSHLSIVELINKKDLNCLS